MSTGPIDVRPIVVAVGDGPADDAVEHVAALREAAPSAAIVAVVDDASAGLDLRLLEAGADEIADGVAADAVPERLVARAVIRRRERVTLAGRLAARAAV